MTLSPGKFVTTGSMTVARWLHTATLLSTGMVLITGGEGLGGGALSSAELYNPGTGTFSPTGSMHAGRKYHTATLLNDGRVLVAGGENSAGTILTSAEIYNPATGVFTLTGSLMFALFRGTATRLQNGTVLFTGGRNAAGTASKLAETYSSASGHFSSTAGMSVARYDHMATLLGNGDVLIVGGIGSSRTIASAEIYHAGSFSTTTSSLAQGRALAATALLVDGRVLIAAGYAYCPGVDPIPSDAACYDVPLASAEIFNPVTGNFSGAASMAQARGASSMPLPGVALLDGRILVAGGGRHSGESLDSAELYTGGSNTFTTSGAMHAHRAANTATRLADGRVLIAGGFDIEAGGIQSSAEVFVP